MDNVTDKENNYHFQKFIKHFLCNQKIIAYDYLNYLFYI